MKTAVLLINLGTPDSPSVPDVKKYLKEFLSDPRVIDKSKLFRAVIVNGIIVPKRAPKSAKIYQELWDLWGGESPLLTYGYKVQELTQERLGNDADVFFAMRYQSPSLELELEKIQKGNYERIIVLPMYPHYASSSTGSTIEKVMEIVSKWWAVPEISIISQFYDHAKYIDAFVARANQYDVKSFDHVLFSYHGLPIRHLDKVYTNGSECKDHDCENEVADDAKFCYKALCYETTRLIADKLGLKKEDYTVAFQSRLGRDPWIQPFSDVVVADKAKEGVKKMLAFSPAFIADCLETSIEIGDEYQEIFEEHGGEKIQLVESLNDHPLWIDCIEDLVRSKM